MMKAGVSVALIDTKRSNPNAYIALAVHHALKRNARIGNVEFIEYIDLNRRLNEKHFDLLIAIDGEQLNIPIFRQAVRRVGASALWVWEDPYERRFNLDSADLFDIVLTNDPASAPFYGSKGHFLPLAGSDEIPVRDDEGAYQYDLFFAGSAWPNRVHFLRRVLREMPGLKTRIVLNYNEGVPSVPLDLPDADYVGSVSHQEFLQTANASRVTLTLHRKFSSDGRKRAAASPGPRLFEIALAGGCQLVEADGVDTTAFFETGGELELFEGFADFRAKLTDLLENSARRMEIAQAAQQRARKDHTFDRRIERLLDLVDTRPKRIVSSDVSATGAAKPTLLFATHNSTASLHFGGVEVYQDTIVSELKEDYRILFFHPAHPPMRDNMREYVVTDDRHAVLQSYRVPDFDMWSTLSHPPLEAVFGSVLDTYKVELIHFHHIINLCPSLPLIAKMIGVPSVFTQQDFWSICKKFNLLEYTGRYCAIAQREKTACDVCLNVTDNTVPGSQQFRRDFFQNVLESISTIIFNTSHTTEVFRAIYPEVDIRHAPILGLPTPLSEARKSDNDDKQRSDDGRLKVVFLGNFTTHKGADIFLDAVSVLGEDLIDFTVCGNVNEPQRSRLNDPRYANIVVEGQFLPGELDLSRFDVALHLSIWPETYCITLSEAWQAGLVPIVTDCGALGDRVTDAVDGLKIPIADAGALVGALRRLSDRSERERIAANIGPHLWLTPAQHVEVLRDIYAKARLAEPVSYGSPDQIADSRGPTLALTRLAALPQRWTTPSMGPRIPQLGADFVLKSTLHSQAATIRQTLREGTLQRLRLSWTLDNLIGDMTTLEGGRGHPNAGAYAPGTIRFEGWLRSLDGQAPEAYFALRSGEGDLFMLPHQTQPRPDVVASVGGLAEGFATDSFRTEMLDGGVYGLELFQLFPGGVGMAALPFVVHVGGKCSSLLTSESNSSTSDQVFARIPVRTELHFAPSAPTDAQPVRYTIEKLDVLNKQPSLDPPLWQLELGGWLVAPTRDFRKPMRLHMVGPQYYNVEIFHLERPDVSTALEVSLDDVSGFSGSVFLSALEAGEYRLFLGFVDAGADTRVHLGQLEIGTGSPLSTIAER